MPHALRGVSFSTTAGEKVGSIIELTKQAVFCFYFSQGVFVLWILFLQLGIVGRTGSGKSSLFQVLFRMVQYQGAVLLDGINVALVPLDILRLVSLCRWTV